MRSIVNDAAFRNRFGGECLTHAPDKPKPRTSATSRTIGVKRNGDDGQEPDHDYGPKNDGTYVVEFRTAAGEALAISIPSTEASVVRYLQERMPYGLFVPDVP
jgi:hypothetical protein